MIENNNKKAISGNPSYFSLLKRLIFGLLLVTTFVISLSSSYAAATATNVAPQKTIVLQAGDILYLSFPGETEFNKDFPIDEKGRILLPEFGEMVISGKTLTQGRAAIKKALSKTHLQLDHLKIMLKERRLPVTVLGQVTKPGKFLLVSKANAQQAITDAGGLLFDADAKHIQLRRAGKVTTFNYQRYLNSGDPKSLPTLKPSDVIFVPRAKGVSSAASWLKISPKHSVQVLGAVGRPGRYDWSDQMTLIDLLTQAGGPTANADAENVKILSNKKLRKPIIFDLENFLQHGGNIATIPKIRGGYTVIVPEVHPGTGSSLWFKQKPEDTVYVFGEVGTPGRYRYHPSMSFLDLIATAGGTTGTANTHDIHVIDRNLEQPEVASINLAYYFQTGDKALLPQVIPGDAIYVPSREGNWLDKSPQSVVRVMGAVGKPGRYHFTDNMSVLDLLAEAGGPSGSAYLKSIVVINSSAAQHRSRSFNMLRYAKTGDPRLLPVLRRGDTVFVPDIKDSPYEQFFKIVRDVASLAIIYDVFYRFGDNGGSRR